MATQEHTLKEALAQDRATITLACYKARECLKQAYRMAGIKLTSVRASDLTIQADEYLKTHPECMEWAREAVTKITSAAPRKRC